MSMLIKNPLTAIGEAAAQIKSGRFVFMSSCGTGWGGSEELWASTAKYLKQQGHEVYIYKANVVATHHRIAELQQADIPVTDTLTLDAKKHSLMRQILPRLSQRRIINRILRFSKRYYRFLSHWLPLHWRSVPDSDLKSPLAQKLKGLLPDLVIISQGENFDGLEFATLCRKMKLPYVMISQKAGEDRWPSDELRPLIKMAFQEAVRCYFVSQHNLRITEMQISQKLPHAEVVRNPYLTPVASTLPWRKPQNSCFKLACVGRLYLLDKGQDILLQVLAQSKWKSRNLHVSFFGEGVNQKGLMELAQFLDVNEVSFPGFIENIVDIWQEFHGLILASRAEGLPLALVEAMMCGRFGIMTDVGGVSEVITDNVTGFIAATASFDAIDEALERAWQRRNEWEQISQKAGVSIREMIPPDPERVFADKLLQLCQEAAEISSN